MKLDTHTHVMLKPFYGLEATDPEKLLSDFVEYGFEGCWISSIDSLITRDLNVQRVANDALAELAERFPGRFEGFCTVEPSAMEDGAREIERCATELHLLGVKMHPWLQAFSVTHPGMDMVMEAAGSFGMPVLFHDGTPPYATPRQIGWLAAKHPNTTVILGHMGLADLWRDAVDCAVLHENIWLQPTGAPVAAIRVAAEAVGTDRLLFGADSGFGSARILGYRLSLYEAALGEEAFEKVLTENPQKLKSKRKR